MLENAGRDATSAILDETSHSKRAVQLMKLFCIGMLVENECQEEGEKNETDCLIGGLQICGLKFSQKALNLRR